MDFRPSEYRRPGEASQALDLLQRYGGRARIIAGGTDLLVRRPSGVECLIDIAALGLRYIKQAGSVVSIGAATRAEAIERSTLISGGSCAALSEAAHAMATSTIRNMATIGGNICNASPAADLAVALMALDASVAVAGPGGNRSVPIGEIFVDVNKTALRDDEFVLEVTVPDGPPSSASCFLKLRRHQTSVDLAVVNAAVSIANEGGVCGAVRIAIGAVAKTPMYAARAQGSLAGKKLDALSISAAAKIASEESKPIDDIRASAGYRRKMVEVLVRRALETCGRRCQLWES